MSDLPQVGKAGFEETSARFGDVLAQTVQRLGELIRPPRLSRKHLGMIAALAAVAWCSTAIYKVQPDEQGVILRFGKWVGTSEPGLHFHLPYPIETVLFPKVTQINQVLLGDLSSRTRTDRQMLTGDENIVEADCSVFWRIKDAGKYLFRVDSPEAVVKVAAEGALRQVIGRTPIQAAMSGQRQQIADQTKQMLQAFLDAEQIGIQITQVQLQRVDPPAPVTEAFNDVQRARADQERARNEAEAYANDIIPRARGEAERIKQDAEAYKTETVNLAEGEANAFLSVYQSYAAAKDVTAWRMYLEAIDEVLKKSGRVIIEPSGAGTPGIVPYLPLTDGQAKAGLPAPSGSAAPSAQAGPPIKQGPVR